MHIPRKKSSKMTAKNLRNLCTDRADPLVAEVDEVITYIFVQMRKDQPVLRRRRFFAGMPEQGGESDLGEIDWFKPDAQPMTDGDWETWYARSVMIYLNGNAIFEPDEYGRKVTGDSLLIMLNGDGNEIVFTLPPSEYGEAWETVIYTSTLQPEAPIASGETVTVEGRSILILRAVKGE